MVLPICPFCGCDPYHYIDNGVGMERVSVTCCELGVEYFAPREEPPACVTIGWDSFEIIADMLRAMRRLGLSPDIEM